MSMSLAGWIAGNESFSLSIAGSIYIIYLYIYILRKPASWLVAVCERSENRGCGGVVAERERNLAVPLC